MTKADFAESIIKAVAFALLESIDWSLRYGTEICPGELSAELRGNSHVVSEQHLHDTLRPKLISGELRVPDVEKTLEEAV